MYCSFPFIILMLDRVSMDHLMQKMRGFFGFVQNLLLITFSSLLSCGGGGDGLQVGAGTPKRAERRRQVVSEMLDTEENYLSVLETLIEVCFTSFDLSFSYCKIYYKNTTLCLYTVNTVTCGRYNGIRPQ